MTIWAIADLHLSFGVPSKNMDVFGPEWADYAEKIKTHWLASVAPEDLVLIAGDVSWAMHLAEAKIDLDWIDVLPGTKLMIRGNHDYWWSSPTKVQSILPPSIHFIQNNVFQWKDVSIGGTRLWDSDEYSFHEYIIMRDSLVSASREEKPDQEKIFRRELERLELSLKQLDQKAKARIVMTHYPPISADLQPSRTSALLEKYNVDVCVFGHLHNLVKNKKMFGERNGVRYLLTAGDYLDFRPLQIFSM